MPTDQRAGHSEAQQVVTGRRRRSLDRWVMDVLGNEWCGSAHPPMDHRTLYVQEGGVHRVFSLQNDGFDVGIGYPDQWHVIMSSRTIRLFVRWWLRQVAADWFGLRSWLWYTALHRCTSGRWKFDPYRAARRRKKIVRPSSHDEWVATGERS